MADKPKGRRCFNGRDEWISALKNKGISVERGHFPSRAGGLTAFTLFEVDKEGPLTLLLHGTGNDHLFTFQAMIDALLERGQSVLSFDLPGHGHESSTELTEGEFWEAATDLKTFLSYRTFDRRTLNAIGYSLGGLFLLLIMDQALLKLNRLVLLAVPLRVKLSLSFVLYEAFSLLSPSFHRQGRSFGWGETIPAFGAFRREDFPLRLPETYRKSYPEFVDELLLKKPPLSLLTKLSHNCLVVFGQNDKLAPPGDALRWREQNPHIKLVTVDRANHFLLPFHKPTIDLVTHWIPA